MVCIFHKWVFEGVKTEADGTYRTYKCQKCFKVKKERIA